MQILKNSWGISWHNKFLWWFGLFIALGGGSANFRLNLNTKDFSPEQKEKAIEFLAQNTNWIIPITTVLVIIFLVLAVVSVIARGALIKSVYHIIQKTPTNFKSGWKEGRKYFWRIFLVSFLMGLSAFLFVIVLAVPIIFLFINKAYFIGGILLILAILILIPLIILISYIGGYSHLYIVLGELSIREAVENAYTLFRQNILSSIIMSLLFFPIGILTLFVYLTAFLPFLLVFGSMALVSYFILGKIAAIIIAGVGALLFILCVLVIASFYSVFSQTAWVLFFQEIATPNEEEKAEETIHELEEEAKTLPTPEPMKPIKME